MQCIDSHLNYMSNTHYIMFLCVVKAIVKCYFCITAHQTFSLLLLCAVTVGEVQGYEKFV